MERRHRTAMTQLLRKCVMGEIKTVYDIYDNIDELLAVERSQIMGAYIASDFGNTDYPVVKQNASNYYADTYGNFSKEQHKIS
jgi:hypothetical protein